jgi:hypothetical protein
MQFTMCILYFFYIHFLLILLSYLKKWEVKGKHGFFFVVVNIQWTFWKNYIQIRNTIQIFVFRRLFENFGFYLISLWKIVWCGFWDPQKISPRSFLPKIWTNPQQTLLWNSAGNSNLNAVGNFPGNLFLQINP